MKADTVIELLILTVLQTCTMVKTGVRETSCLDQGVDSRETRFVSNPLSGSLKPHGLRAIQNPQREKQGALCVAIDLEIKQFNHFYWYLVL